MPSRAGPCAGWVWGEGAEVPRICTGPCVRFCCGAETQVAATARAVFLSRPCRPRADGWHAARRHNGVGTDIHPMEEVRMKSGGGNGGRDSPIRRKSSARPAPPMQGPGGYSGLTHAAEGTQPGPQKRVRSAATARARHSLRAGGFVDGAVSAAGASPEIGFGPGWLRSQPAHASMVVRPAASVAARASRNVAIGKRITVPPDGKRETKGRRAAERPAARFHSSS